MIENEDEIMRLLLVLLNSLGILISSLVLLALRKIGHFERQTGHLISLVIVLEVLFSLMILLSQFYTDDPY